MRSFIGSVGPALGLLGGLTLASLSFAGPSITNNLVLHLTFDNTYADSSGNGLNGTAVGNPTFVPGRVGSGAVSVTTLMDGSEFDYVTLGYPDQLKFGSVTDGTATDFTVSFWCSYTNQVDDPPFIATDNWMSSGNQGWIIATQGGGNFRVVATDENGGKLDTKPNSTVRDGAWHNIVVAFGRVASSNAVIYVDGVSVSTNTMTPPVNGSVDTDALGNSVNIGQDGTGGYTDGGSAQMVNVHLDDVAIWRRLLSAQEAATIYHNGLAGKSFDVDASALPPIIATQPVSQTHYAGASATFKVEAGGISLSYEWFAGTNRIDGATNNVLTLTGLTPSQTGDYKVVVTNPNGSAPSDPAHLTVLPVATLTTISNALAVHLKLDDNYQDASGNGINGTAVGSPTFVPGKIGTGAVSVTTLMDGSEFDYITLGYPDLLKFGSTVDFTISFWCNYTNSVDDPALISNKDWMASANQGWIIATQGDGNFRVNTTGEGGTKQDTSATPVVRDGTWHLVTVSYTRTADAVIYVDGTRVGTSTLALTTGSIDTDALSTPLAVNIGEDGTGQYTDGGSAQMINVHLDDVAIWRRALADLDVEYVYVLGQQGLSFDAIVVSTPPQFNPVTLSGSTITLSWTGSGTLQETTDLAGSWNASANQSNPQTVQVSGTGQKFYRIH